jgi:hypothetical protein
MIKLLDLLEKKMTPAQKKKRGKIYDKLVAGGMESDKAGAIATSKAMAEKMDPVGQEDEDIDNDGDVDSSDKYLLKRRKAIASNIKEGDHEVSMAQASLKAIIEATMELSNKIGNMERNIPGWIQDHIAKAENYIEQAAQGFHELKHGGEHLDEAVSIDIPENTSYEELAIAVANILKNDYGEHNFKPFIEILVAKLKS